MRQSDLTAHALFRDETGSVALAAAHGLFGLHGASAGLAFAPPAATSANEPLPELAAQLRLDDANPAMREAALAELLEAGLVAPPSLEVRLAQARIKILGSGRLARHIVDDLVSTGLRDLVLWDNEPPDLSVYDNFTRTTGAQSLKSWLVARHGHEWTRWATVVNHWTKPEHLSSDVTIIATDYVETDRAITDGLLRADQVQLFVRPFRRGVIVGPLVIPGRTPCTRCYDLARSVRAPLWPAALSRLTRVRHTTDPVWARWAASQIVVAVGGFLAGHSVELMGATVEICAEEPNAGVRPWSLHPECGCDLIDAV